MSNSIDDADAQAAIVGKNLELLRLGRRWSLYRAHLQTIYTARAKLAEAYAERARSAEGLDDSQQVVRPEVLEEIEAGRCYVSLERLRALARVYEVTPQYLRTDHGATTVGTEQPEIDATAASLVEVCMQLFSALLEIGNSCATLGSLLARLEHAIETGRPEPLKALAVEIQQIVLGQLQHTLEETAELARQVITTPDHLPA